MKNEGVVEVSVEQLTSVIQTTINKSFEDNKTDFYVEPKLHYDHHKQIGEFFSGLQENYKLIKKIAITSAVLIVLGMFGTGAVAYIVNLKIVTP